MSTEHDINLTSIGSDLLDHAQEFGESNRLPVITQLFPFVLLASRRMTMREMSAWLDTEKGVKLSPAMMTKGLKRPDLHLRRIAEFVHPLAAYIAAVYHYTGHTAKTLLYDKNPATWESALQELRETTAHAPDGMSDGISDAFETLFEAWEPIPEEVKFMCLPYFDFNEESSDEASDDTP